MPGRIGIEIAPSACRIVQIERPGKSDDADTIVRAFTVASEAGGAALAPYQRQAVAVVAWGLHADHRQAVVTRGSYQRMRREAVNATREAGVDTRQMLADIAPVATAGKERRRPVVVALARTSEIAAAVRPLAAAGLKVRSIVTPALALMSLSRLRRRMIAAGLVEAYVALDETRTAIALVRDGALIAARELDWGFLDGRMQVRSRNDVMLQLGAAIEEFFGDCGAPPSVAAQVCICGGMPELRSMTLALTERLDVEVEPLDSLFGIDADRLPSDDFRERAAELRLAWAVAADWNAPIDFLRERRRRMVKTTLTRAAVVAGVATGLGIAWRIQGKILLETPEPAPKAAPALSAAVRSRPVTLPRPAPAPPVAATPAPAPQKSVPPPAALALAPPPAPVAKPAVPPPPQVVLRTVPEPAKPAPARQQQAEPPLPVSVPPPPAVVRPARRPPAEELPLPFEGNLGTILYGAERKLAIVDGRIVQVGDDVRGARVVEITPIAVFFRDRQGRLRRLTLEDSRK